MEREATIAAGADFPATPVFAVFPPGAERGVVVLHEIFGRQPEIDQVVRRFGERGYAAVAPDLFRASGFVGCIRMMMRAMRDGQGPAVAQAAAIRTWLCEQSNVLENKVGIIGFCLGGSFALAVGRGWGAVSTNYGSLPKSERALRGMGPTIGCYGGRDRAYGNLAPTLEARLRPYGVEVETHTFPDVGHSFLTDGRRPVFKTLTSPMLHIDYKPETAEAGWSKIMAFFDDHLTARPTAKSQGIESEG